MSNYSGLDILKQFISQMPLSPGIYKMISHDQKILYIGKAKNLPKRVSNYLQLDKLTPRIRIMVQQIHHIEVITTNTEIEALLLEASLIKKFKPKYNILLKDDKSFPYISLDQSHEFGKIAKYRGEKEENITYFGPFAKSSNVDDTIDLLCKLFQLRSCSDHYFKTRTRPCMLYQLKRCSAPCVGKITHAKYNESLGQAKDFLSGKSSSVQKQLAILMDQASNNLDYESAAQYRDRIKSLNYIQSKQIFTNLRVNNADIIVIYQEMGEYCIEIFFFRNSQSYGNKEYFPSNIEDESSAIFSFIGQFYQNNPIPDQIIIKDAFLEIDLMQDALSIIAKKNIKISIAKSKEHLSLIELALDNAKQAIKSRINTKSKQLEYLIKAREVFNLGKIPQRIEIYDNSHIMGSNAFGAMVVATENGFDKSSYRKFELKNHNGDDYAMMQSMLRRRFTRLKKEYPIYIEKIWPDLLIIDGGPSHLSVTKKILDELELDIKFIAIAKGDNRNAGGETIYQVDREPVLLKNDNILMQFIQKLRDEAHRYAITSHRNKRDKNLTLSILDHIPNIGKQRKSSLLQHFGSIDNIKKASIEELTKASYISKNIANIIYNFFKE